MRNNDEYIERLYEEVYREIIEETAMGSMDVSAKGFEEAAKKIFDEAIRKKLKKTAKESETFEENEKLIKFGRDLGKSAAKEYLKKL